MSETHGTENGKNILAAALHERAAQAAALQHELARKVSEINQHWLERIQTDSTDAWQTLFKFGSTPAVGEKIKLCEQWLEAAMKKAADDATYVLESAKALGQLELRFLSPPSTNETKPEEQAASDRP